MLQRPVAARPAELVRDSLDYWSHFYAGSDSAAVPRRPSPFAEWVHHGLGRRTAIVELGFGNARDSFWLASQGHGVTGFDGADSAVANAAQRTPEGSTLTFGQLDLTMEDAVDEIADRLLSEQAAEAVYARFLLHSLPAVGRDNVIRLASRGLVPGGALFVEFRTGQDANAAHAFGDDHFRAYLDPEDVADRIREFGGEVTHFEQGHGLAPYKSEDPHVARIVATWGDGG